MSSVNDCYNCLEMTSPQEIVLVSICVVTMASQMTSQAYLQHSIVTPKVSALRVILAINLSNYCFLHIVNSLLMLRRFLTNFKLQFLNLQYYEGIIWRGQITRILKAKLTSIENISDHEFVFILSSVFSIS